MIQVCTPRMIRSLSKAIALFAIASVLSTVGLGVAQADSVVGTGQAGFATFAIDASSGANGENPTGTVTSGTPIGRFSGPVTALCVSGNTAVVAGPLIEGSSPSTQGYALHVKDNAQSGTADLLRLELLGYVPEGCLPFALISPAAVTSGDLVVTDITTTAQGAVVPFNPDLYRPLAAEWWKWALSVPLPANPICDTKGVHAHVGQTAAVFFMAGTCSSPVTRSVTISSKERLFFPIINIECSTVEPDPFHGVEVPQLPGELTFNQCADQWIHPVLDGPTLFATINGVPVPDLVSFRARSSPFDFRVPAQNNFLGLPHVTRGRAVADGYWLLLEPFAPGTHTIHFEGTMVDTPFGAASQNVTYILTVE